LAPSKLIDKTIYMLGRMYTGGTSVTRAMDPENSLVLPDGGDTMDAIG
jgi:hypothetical protein